MFSIIVIDFFLKWDLNVDMLSEIVKTSMPKLQFVPTDSSEQLSCSKMWTSTFDSCTLRENIDGSLKCESYVACADDASLR